MKSFGGSVPVIILMMAGLLSAYTGVAGKQEKELLRPPSKEAAVDWVG